MVYQYTKDWNLHSEIRRALPKVCPETEPHHILEIGSYEGLSACFFADNFLGHVESRLICVDPFDLADTTSPLTTETQKTFEANIAKSKHPNKVQHHRQYSQEFFAHNTDTFDVIYIDGSHIPEHITADMEAAWLVLRADGIMWLDDYLGGRNGDIKAVMDAFTEQHAFDAVVIHRGYQLALRRLV